MHGGEFGQHLVHVRILFERLTEEPPEVVDGERYAGEEMGLLLEISPESVCSQNLEIAEKDKQTEPTVEKFLIEIRHEAPQGTEIAFEHLLLEIFRITGPGLPDEGSHIIIDGASSSPLEVYEIRDIVLDHDIPRLEIPVKERLTHVFKKVVLELLEVILEFDLIEIKTRSLEETVLEIIEVEHYHPLAECRFGIAYVPIQPFPATELYPGELFHRGAKKHPFIRGILP